MSYVSSSLKNASINHRWSNNSCFQPVASFHGKFVSVFSKELPPSGKFCEVMTRIMTVVIAPFAYLSLALLGLGSAACDQMGYLAERIQDGLELLRGTGGQLSHIQFRKLTYDGYWNYSIDAYVSMSKKLDKLWSDQDISYMRKKGSPEGIESMHQELSSSPSIYLFNEHDETRQEEQLTKILGKGGSKKAVQISKGRALLVPNMDVDGMNAIYGRWPRIVEEEVQMSSFLQEIGLLGLRLEKVMVFSDKDSENCIPAYVTESFDGLKEKNIYILDSKNVASCTWQGESRLFKNLEAAKKLENWKPLIELLAKDIAKLVYYQLSVGGDSFNIAICRNQDGDKIRYFGFDYTSKCREIEIPIITKETHQRINRRQKKQLLERIKSAFSNAIELVLYQEYQAKWSLPDEAYALNDALVDKYSMDILQEVYALQKAYTQEG